MTAEEEAKHAEVAKDIVEHATNPLVGLMLAQHYLRGARLIDEALKKPETKPETAVA